MLKSKEEFFMNMFHYGKNGHCGSGHPDNLVHGWARHFFDDLKEPSRDLEKFHCHTNYVCMKALNLNGSLAGYFIQMVSLAFSELDKGTNTMTPQYGIVTYRIRGKEIFNKLAFIKEEKKWAKTIISIMKLMTKKFEKLLRMANITIPQKITMDVKLQYIVISVVR